MKQFPRYIISLIAIVIAAALVFTGCGSDSNNETGGGSITEAGSTTVQPVAEAIAEAFMAVNTDITVMIQGGGSSTGVKSASDGTVDIGAASRELKESEKDLGLVEHVLARDGIAIITHPNQAVGTLTTEQVMQIFAGEITNWSELGGADAEIHVVAREEGSGTRSAFEEMVMGEALIANDATLQPSNGAIKTTVSSDVNALGFVSFGYIDDTVKAMTIDGVPATVETAKSGTYPIVRPLLFLTRGEPTGIVKDFIDYCLGAEGQTIVEEEGYIGVN